MAAVNPKSNVTPADQVKRLETELKAAFQEGRFEEVRKKAEEMKKADPQNRLAQRILEKVSESEAAAFKRANAEKISDLEKKMDQAFKAGNLAVMTQLAGETKKLDPTNKKALKIEGMIANAKASLEVEIKKEKIRKLMAELAFFTNKADWSGAMAKANEVLALDSGNAAALGALRKAAKAQNVAVPSLVTPAKAVPGKTPGFFARLFGHKASEVKAPVAQKPMVSQPLPTKESPKAVAPKVVVPVAPVAAQAKPVEPLAKAVVAGPKPVLATAPAKFIEEKKPVVAVAPVAPAAGLFGSLFAKRESEKPAMPVMVSAPAPKPVTAPAQVIVAKPMVSPVVTPVAAPAAKPSVPVVVVPHVVPQAAKPVEAQLKVEQKAVAKPETGALEKGNIFTSLFGKKEEMEPEKPSASVLETIVAKTAPAKSESKVEKRVDEGTGEKWLGFANAFLQFAVAFIVVSAAFLYVENLDTGNQVLSIAKMENNAIQLHNASVALDAKKGEEQKLNLEIKKFEGGYEDEHRTVINKIVTDRMDWTDILKKLNEVTESVYEKNALSQYVQYNNYSYNAKTGQLTVGATLSDPLGKNLTKLAEIEDAFRNYPKDPQNPKDDRKPYFYGIQEFKSYSKSFNTATGRYQSQFTLTLFTKPQSKK